MRNLVLQASVTSADARRRGVAISGRRSSVTPIGKRDVDQIGVGESGSQIVGESFVERAAILRFATGFRAVPAGNVDVR